MCDFCGFVGGEDTEVVSLAFFAVCVAREMGGCSTKSSGLCESVS